jgi:hypothetical protein
MLSRLNSPLVSALIVALVISLFIFGRLYQSRFDFSSFVVAGDTYCDPAGVPQSLTVLRNSAGFDGQFYYRLSLNPFTSQVTEFGITLEAPPLRHQRILYPFLTWSLSLGRAELVPVMLVLINFISLCVMGWIGGAYAQTLRQHALWGLFLPLYPGFLFTLSRDLVEILEITLLLGSLLLIRRSQPVAATLLLALAVLTKETALLVAAAALLVYVFKWWRDEDAGPLRWYYFAVPLSVFFLWQIALFYNWGVFPIYASGHTNLGLPLLGPASFLSEMAQLQTPFQRRTFVELIFLIVFTSGILYQLRSTAASTLEITSWLLYAALAVSLSRAVWIEDWTFFRAVAQSCALGTIIMIAGTKARVKAFIFGCSSLFWLYLFVRLMRHYS